MDGIRKCVHPLKPTFFCGAGFSREKSHFNRRMSCVFLGIFLDKGPFQRGGLMALVQTAPGAPTPGLAVLKVSNSVFTRERTKNSPKSKTLFQHVLLETLGQKAPGAPTLVSAVLKVPNFVFPRARATNSPKRKTLSQQMLLVARGQIASGTPRSVRLS